MIEGDRAPRYTQTAVMGKGSSDVDDVKAGSKAWLSTVKP